MSSWRVYPSAYTALRNGTISLNSDSFSLMLLSDSYVPDYVNDNERADIVVNQVGPNRSATISRSTNIGLDVISISNKAVWDGPLSVRYVALFDDSHINDLLVAVFDLGSVQTIPAGATFSVESGDVFTMLIGSGNVAVTAGTASLVMDGLPPTIATVANSTLDWFSDWRNATGNTDAAFLDGGKWTGYISTPVRSLASVIPASGLGFPSQMTNVWRYEIPNSPEACQPRVAGQWTMPAVGEYQYYRHYIRCDFPETHNPADQHYFHIGSDTGAAVYESTYWLNGVEGGVGGGVLNGEYRIQFMPNWQNTTYPDTAWYNIYLTTTNVYRLELRVFRETTNNLRYTSRVYDSAGNLRDTAGRDQQVWFEYYGGQGWTDLPDFVVQTVDPATTLEIIEVGYNGSGPTGSFTPTPYVYMGGLAVRVSASANDWIGPYPVTGVED